MSINKFQKNNSSKNDFLDSLSSSIAKNIDKLASLSFSKRQEAIMNILMRAERNLYLNNNANDKGNGYYHRYMGTPFGELNLSVPRVRKGDFRPQVLPPKYGRDLIERMDIMEALLSASYSPSHIKSVLKQMGLHYSEEDLKKLVSEFVKEFEVFCNRELPSDAVAIYIDAYVSDIMENGSIKKLTIFSVLGIDFNGKKDLLGIYFILGNETKEEWLKVLNDLIRRGLKRVIMVVSDNFNGLKDAVKVLYPKAFHQLCVIHLMRNVKRNMSKEDAKQINNSIRKAINNANNYDEALLEFEKIFSVYKDKYPKFIGNTLKDIRHYVAFFNFHFEVRKYFYTTNPAESFNSILESIRRRSGGFFMSYDVVKANIYINYLKLKKRWDKGNPILISNLYYLKQLFAQIYEDAPVE